MDWLKQAVSFKLTLGDAPDFTQAYIQRLRLENGAEAWCISSNKRRLANDGSGWLDDPFTFIRHDIAKTIPEREKELDNYRRRYTFETKEHALDTYVAWRHSQGDLSYNP